jgi:hypothetical protein
VAEIVLTVADAIVVRHGTANAWELMVVDGGDLDYGKARVSHVKNHFGYNAVVAHTLVTHPDGDHASSMREVLDGLPVRNLWLRMPWQFAAATRAYFANKNCTDQGLAQAARRIRYPRQSRRQGGEEEHPHSTAPRWHVGRPIPGHLAFTRTCSLQRHLEICLKTRLLPTKFLEA